MKKCDKECLYGATHPALRAPLSERGWLRSALIGTCLRTLTDVQTATATSPLGEGMATQCFDWYLFTHTDRRPNRYRDIPSRRGEKELPVAVPIAKR